MDWVARAVGLFYLAGGLLAVSAFARELWLDRAIVAIDPAAAGRAERAATVLLLIGAVLTAFAGLALLLLSLTAPVLFVVNLLWQIGYQLWARRWHPAEDAAAVLGRRRAINAAMLWAAITVFVIALWMAGVVA